MKITLPNITKGPWSLRCSKALNNDSKIVESPESEEGWIHTIADTSTGSLEDDEQRANALAISALPQCLEALEKVLRTAEPFCLRHNADLGCFHAARQALLAAGAKIEF